MVLVNGAACKGCGICIAMCPVKILSFSGKLNETGVRFPEVSNQEKCVKCGNCMIYCPDFAMVVTDDE